MKIAIVTGGLIEDLSWLKAQLSRYDLLLAVDRGLEATEALGLTPDLIIGDFDSYRGDQAIETRYPEAEILTFSSVKDWTDTELALQKAVELSCSSEKEAIIDLYGAFGNRMDHTYANLMLLGSLEQKSPRIRALDPDNEVERLFPGTYRVARKDGFNVSVLSLDETAEVTLRGFEYDGEKLILRRAGTLGVSNRLKENEGFVTLHSGKVFLMQCRDRA
ncbi:thiamine diphosphokinase [Acidaminobacter sp.]|uniref:thiamine diphosphokinase n=1 Tax=Acidaminobacter sp. TaxID=1872102 RepID=UPI001383608A|nr:thiamine diphosphokinase [Acidaminobacter sp.]MDK9709621.1 thiamine diphosphokinase [Acidaminobacter sp.]MZQ97858.1 thiamine diphosphokinase [Acidaminobacter sp.]